MTRNDVMRSETIAWEENRDSKLIKYVWLVIDYKRRNNGQQVILCETISLFRASLLGKYSGIRTLI